MFTAEQLLHPISAAEPVGIDLSFSSDFDAIAVARRFDDPSLDQGEWVSEHKVADWDFVVQRCETLLTHKSKDLRLAVWLTEALARQHTLRGLAEGLRLLAGLCTRFWDSGLYPRSGLDTESAEHEERIGNLRWILARVAPLLSEMTPTDLVTNSNASSSTPPHSPHSDHARKHTMEIQCCLDALLELEQAVDLRLGIDSPGFSAAKEALQALLPFKVSQAGGLMPPLTLEADASCNAHVPVTRTQAIAQLRLLAQFFRHTEPHSPASYFADKAAEAAGQDLHSWLRGVVKDGAALAHIEELLGVQAPAPNQR